MKEKENLRNEVKKEKNAGNLSKSGVETSLDSTIDLSEAERYPTSSKDGDEKWNDFLSAVSSILRTYHQYLENNEEQEVAVNE